MADFLPKLKEDPSYLTNKRIEVIKGYGRNAETLDPESIDWNDVGWREMGELRFVQSPGDHNALGKVRVLMPNQYNIYMHDTNHPEYFERGQRTYSSGCIRLSEPEELARFVMKGASNWSEEIFEEILASGETEDIKISQPFPVYIIYQSVWLDQNGQVVFGPDVYKRDKELVDILASIDGYQLPESAGLRYANADGKTQPALAYQR
jgi:murein L,D-transpeptidase YcbB/YkuD